MDDAMLERLQSSPPPVWFGLGRVWLATQGASRGRQPAAMHVASMLHRRGRPGLWRLQEAAPAATARRAQVARSGRQGKCRTDRSRAPAGGAGHFIGRPLRHIEM
jgi:hypothetical protein